MTKYKNTIYYFIIILLFVIENRFIYFFKINDSSRVVNNVLRLENSDLKDEIKELSNINYNDYEYEIGKITINNVYNSDSVYIKYNGSLDNHLVLNDIGLVGVIDNNKLIKTKNLNLSIKINDVIGQLKDNKIIIDNNNYNVGDKIYTSGLNNISSSSLVALVSSRVS